MAYRLTPWGYEVDGDLPPLIDRDQVDDLTDGKWANDPRVEPMLGAASAAIRNHCGWHVAPSLPCRATIDGDGQRVLWLPTTCMTDLDALAVGGVVDAGAQWSRIGEVWPSLRVPHALRAVTAEYRAGYDEPTDDLVAAAVGVIVHAVALSYGVTSESAGGVSVSYASGAAYGGAAMANLTDADRQTLAPYKAVRAHAT